MVKEKNKYQIISAVLLIIVVAFASLYFIKASSSQEINEQTCAGFINECPEVPKEKALVDAQVYDWAENLDNPNEMFFQYWIYNYGNVEAKNIQVRCDLWNEEGTLIVATAIDNFGNLASLSTDFGELVTEDKANNYDYYIPLCYVESCDNCEILYKRIPELIESYEG
ncbi:MAG: hypothetical protein WC511_00605 [Candidatus Pacearchaeota archaeon]|jgi:hypothetical protein